MTIYIYTCTKCKSKLEEYEVKDNSCPFCYPKKPILIKQQFKSRNGIHL